MLRQLRLALVFIAGIAVVGIYVWGFAAMSAYGRLILAIRKEFGHQDVSLEEKDIFRVIFNDELETLLAMQISLNGWLPI